MAAYYSRAHICQCLTRISTLRRSSIITVTGDRLKTGELFVEGVLSLARGLLELGIQAGDVVAICAFNSDWYLEWLLAVAFVGGIVAPLNYRWSFEEAKSAMLTVEPVMLVRDDSCNAWNSELINDIITSLRWHVFLESSSSVCTRLSKVLTTEALRRSIKESPQMTYSWAPEAAVIVCFTSGTTGRPKGVMISHSALIVQSLAKVAIAGYSEDDVYLHTAPLCHIGGLSSAMSMLMVGASHILMPKFEATIAADAINKHFVTSLITVPAMMADMISVIRDKETWMGKQSVTKILNGGGSLTAELIKDANKCFPRARLLSAYGMTEACSSLAFICLYDPIHKIPDQTGKTTFGSPYQPQGVCVGKPAPHVELKICSDSYPPTGRILTRGPHLMLRYWDQKPKRLSDTNDEEVWLDTGDVGSIDDSGNIWLVGRANGRIKSGGENVYPEEVETILLQHPGITAAVIVGIPDSRLTEMVVACIKLRESWQWDDHSCEPVAANKLVLCNENLRIYCKEKNLTGFKVPKKFILWKAQFPLTTTGKIRRDQVRRAVMSHLQQFHSTL